MNKRLSLIAIAGLLVALCAAACGGADSTNREGAGTKRESVPATAEEKRARGDAILRQMSDKLKSAEAFTFVTAEVIERVRRNNEKVTLNVERRAAVRRPDRLWFQTSGDRELECTYDGRKVTLVSHKEKVFGEFPAPATLDETADAITYKYDIPLPIADLLTPDPQNTLKDEGTTGGMERLETVEGVECNVLAYQHPNVDFSLWVPTSGDPLPKKLSITYKARRGQPTTTVLFRNWNLTPQVSDDTFARKVPADYEGIPVIQSVRALVPSTESEEKEAAQKPTATPSGDKK